MLMPLWTRACTLFLCVLGTLGWDIDDKTCSTDPSPAQGICGAKLSEALEIVCHSRRKRWTLSTSEDTHTGRSQKSYQLAKRDALTMTKGVSRKKRLTQTRGIICECCVYRCSYEEMKEYCDEDGGYNGPSAQTVNSKRSHQDQTENTVKEKEIYSKDKSHDITFQGQSNTGYLSPGTYRDYKDEKFKNSKLQHQRPWDSNIQEHLPGLGHAGLKLDGSRPSLPNPSEVNTLPYPQWTKEIANPQMDNGDLTEFQNIRLNLILNNETKIHNKNVTDGVERKNKSSTANEELSEYFGEKSTSDDDHSAASAKLDQNVIELLQIATKENKENNPEFEHEEGEGKDAERHGILLYNTWKGIKTFQEPEVPHSVSLSKTSPSSRDAKRNKEIGTP